MFEAVGLNRLFKFLFIFIFSIETHLPSVEKNMKKSLELRVRPYTSFFLSLYLFLAVLGVCCRVDFSLVAVSGDFYPAVELGLLPAVSGAAVQLWSSGFSLQ